MRGLACAVTALLFGCGNTVIVESGPGGGRCDAPPCVGVEQGEEFGPCPCDEAHRVEVADAGELAQAMTGGGCIALGPGDYGDVVVTDGVQLVGVDYQEVHIGTLDFEAASTASACRLSVQSARARPDSSATLQYAFVSGSAEDGVAAALSAKLSVIGSTVEGAPRFGIVANGAAALEVVGTAIRDIKGPGLWAQCSEEIMVGCGCDVPGTLIADRVSIDGAELAGFAAVGVRAAIHDVAVRNTHVGTSFEGGGGVTLAYCADVDASAVVVEDNTDYGIAIIDAAARMSDVTAVGNLRGVWLAPGPHTIAIDGATLRGNRGMGFGFGDGDTESTGPVSIANATISDTESVLLPIIVNGVNAGSEEVGDGVFWRDGVTAHLDAVTIRGSARHDVYIDGPAQGSLHDVSTEDGYIIQECAGPSPDISGTTPPISSTCP